VDVADEFLLCPPRWLHIFFSRGWLEIERTPKEYFYFTFLRRSLSWPYTPDRVGEGYGISPLPVFPAGVVRLFRAEDLIFHSPRPFVFPRPPPLFTVFHIHRSPLALVTHPAWRAIPPPPTPHPPQTQPPPPPTPPPNPPPPKTPAPHPTKHNHPPKNTPKKPPPPHTRFFFFFFPSGGQIILFSPQVNALYFRAFDVSFPCDLKRWYPPHPLGWLPVPCKYRPIPYLDFSPPPGPFASLLSP